MRYPGQIVRMLQAQAAAGPATGPRAGVASIVKTERRPDGVAVLTIDDAAGRHNTITPAFTGELGAALDAALADGEVTAIVVRSGKKDSFVAGADLHFVRGLRFAIDAEELSRELARRFA